MLVHHINFLFYFRRMYPIKLINLYIYIYIYVYIGQNFYTDYIVP